MLGILIAKDFRRTFRNPWPWIMNLGLPIAITAVIGFAFGGGGSKGDSDIRIKFAVVDEDQSFLSGALRSALTQGEAGARLDPVFVNREEALRTLRENQISGIFIIPTNFTKRYLLGETNLSLEVIKNPAQSFFPAIMEEMAGVAVTGLNAIERNLTSEFPNLRAATTNANDWNFEILYESVRRIVDRVKAARTYLNPPLISYTKDVSERPKVDEKPAPTPPAAATTTNEPKNAAPAKQEIKPKKERSMIVGVFAYILPGMASAFLLFMADQSMRDFHREIRMKTFDRQRTVGASVGVYIAGKIIFTAMTVMLASVILFAGGTLVFGIEWNHPGLLALACAGYSLFAAGFLAAITALASSERRTEALNSMLVFALAFMGGSYLPADNFPPFMREHVTVWMPNYWLIEAARSLQRPDADFMGPMLVVGKLALAGIALGTVAAFLINRRLNASTRA